MATEDFIVSAASQQELAMQLTNAGVLEMGDGGAFPPAGSAFSFIGINANGAHAFVSITADQSAIDAIKAALTGLINVPGAPLRKRAGGLLPQVMTVYRRHALRMALEELGLTSAFTAAITALVQSQGDQRLKFWAENVDAIHGSEPRWLQIVAQAGWDQTTVDSIFAAALTYQ